MKTFFAGVLLSAAMLLGAATLMMPDEAYSMDEKDKKMSISNHSHMHAHAHSHSHK